MYMLIVNGKKAGLAQIRSTVYQLREQGHQLLVRCTWEGGDVSRFVDEALQLDITRIIAGGGDGTVNEAVNAIMHIPQDSRPELAILPLGTANDFATACNIPSEIDSALAFAVNGPVRAIDIIKANQHYFINVASAGFGAKVTTDTPVELKNLLGGNAYLLSGLIQATQFSPYQGHISATQANGEELHFDGSGIVGAICNGKMAGGGQVLAPFAKLNDGLIDVLLIKDFSAAQLPQVAQAILDTTLSNQYVVRFQCTAINITTEQPLPINLDGEPTQSKENQFSVEPNAVRLVLPDDSNMLL